MIAGRSASCAPFWGTSLFATVCLVAVATASSLAQAPADRQLSDFTGTWKSEFRKQAWLTLTLVPAKNTLTGTLVHADVMTSDNEGEITSVGDEMSTDQVVRAELRDGGLYIETKDDDGDVDRYLITITATSAAQLQPVSASGSPSPRAFKLTRTPAPQK